MIIISRENQKKDCGKKQIEKERKKEKIKVTLKWQLEYTPNQTHRHEFFFWQKSFSFFQPTFESISTQTVAHKHKIDKSPDISLSILFSFEILLSILSTNFEPDIVVGVVFCW